jgi:ribosomal protein S12 methylthiotransferase accessory factor
MITEVENMTASLQHLGMDVFIMNTMHERLQIPAIYTIIPGAHFRERSMINDAGLFAAKLVAESASSPAAANEQLSKMREFLPQAYYLEFYLGRNLHDMGRQNEAMKHLNKALELDPQAEDIPYIYSYMGSCYKDQERFDEAADILHKGLNHDEERPDIHNLLGVCCYKKNDFKQAIKHFHRAVELNPSSAMDYANLGINYRKVNDVEQAVKYFELALSMDPGIDFAREELAQILSRS